MASMDADVVDKRTAYHTGSNQSDTDHTAQICLVSYECAKITQIRCRDTPALESRALKTVWVRSEDLLLIQTVTRPAVGRASPVRPARVPSLAWHHH